MRREMAGIAQGIKYLDAPKSLEGRLAAHGNQISSSRREKN